MAIKVRWLLEQDQVKGMKLIAGAQGLDCSIESVNYFDNPDMIRWLKGGEFLITAGYILNDSEELQQKFMRELWEHNCVGLGIKLRRYLNEVPEAMIRQAEEYQIPIIELPYDRSFAEINSLIYKAIFQSELTQNGQMSLFYNRIFEIVVKDRGNAELFQAIADVIPNPIILTDEHFNLKSYRWQGSYKDSYGQALTLEEGENVFAPSVAEKLLGEYKKRHYEVYIQKLDVPEGELDSIIFPVLEKQNLLGFLIFVESNQLFDVQAYDFVAGLKPIIALELLRDYAEEHGRSRLQPNHLRRILFDDSLSRQEMLEECIQYDFDCSRSRLCTVIYLDEEKEFSGNSTKNLKIYKQMLFDELESIVQNYRLKYYRLYFDNSIILYFLFPPRTKNFECYEEVREILAQFDKRMKEKKLWLEYGTSRLNDGVETIRMGYYQACETLRIGRLVQKNTNLYFYKEQEIYHILTQAMDAKQQKSFYQDTIAVLDAFDKKNGTELLATLEGYIENGNSILEASKALFIHRNTVSARITKIKELLHTDLKDYKECMTLQMGIYVKKLLESEGEL